MMPGILISEMEKSKLDKNLAAVERTEESRGTLKITCVFITAKKQKQVKEGSAGYVILYKVAM